MSTPRDHRRADDGFTLVELLVTMSLAVVVLLAILQGADLFQRTTKTASDTSQAQDTARATMRQVVQTLRQARLPTGQSVPVAAASTPTRSDLVVAAYVTGTANPAPGELPGWVRYCASADGRSLLVGVLAAATYAGPGTCAASTTTNGWRYGLLVDGTLRDSGKLFDYQSGTCVGGRTIGSAGPATCSPPATGITAIGIRLAIARTTSNAAGSTIVRNAVGLRNGSPT